MLAGGEQSSYLAGDEVFHDESTTARLSLFCPSIIQNSKPCMTISIRHYHCINLAHSKGDYPHIEEEPTGNIAFLPTSNRK
jgi:hypothetical protein